MSYNRYYTPSTAQNYLDLDASYPKQRRDDVEVLRGFFRHPDLKGMGELYLKTGRKLTAAEIKAKEQRMSGYKVGMSNRDRFFKAARSLGVPAFVKDSPTARRERMLVYKAAANVGVKGIYASYSQPTSVGAEKTVGKILEKMSSMS